MAAHKRMKILRVSLKEETEPLVSRLKLLLPPLLSTQRSSWEQGVCAQALLECQHFFQRLAISPILLGLPYNLLSWLYALAHDSLVRQAPDGRLAVLLNGDGASDTGALDPTCIGETLFYLASVARRNEHTFPAPRNANATSLLESAEKMLRYILEDCPRAPIRPDGSSKNYGTECLLSHRTDGIEIWSDSIYMISPFLASSAAFYAQTSSRPFTNLKTQYMYMPQTLLEGSLQQIVLAARVLQTPNGKWAHIFDLTNYQFKRSSFWGVGNGWVCCGIVRVINTVVSSDILSDLLVGDGPEGKLRALLHRIYGILLRTIGACLTHMCPSGLYHNILDDPSSFIETNLAQMLAYTFFRLVDLHLYCPRFRELGLSRADSCELAEWERLADMMRDAAILKTDEWGFVRDVCGSPTFDRPGTAAEGQAWAVLMEVARAELRWHRARD